MTTIDRLQEMTTTADDDQQLTTTDKGARGRSKINRFFFEIILKIFELNPEIYNLNLQNYRKMDNATTLGFKDDAKVQNRMAFKNSISKIYMKSQDCGNLGIPEVHPIVSFKGGSKNSK